MYGLRHTYARTPCPRCLRKLLNPSPRWPRVIGPIPAVKPWTLCPYPRVPRGPHREPAIPVPVQFSNLNLTQVESQKLENMNIIDSGGPAVRAARGRSHFFGPCGIVFHRPTLVFPNLFDLLPTIHLDVWSLPPLRQSCTINNIFSQKCSFILVTHPFKRGTWQTIISNFNATVSIN